MRFIVDAQLPPALAVWLAARGYEASHVLDLHLGNATDRAIWDFALSAAATIITKDEDFAHHASSASSAPAIVWIRFGNVRTPQLLARLNAVWPEVSDALNRGELLIELV